MTTQEMAAKGSTFASELAETVKTVVAGLAIALALRVLVFQPYTIPSSSMEPGLVTGDYVVISKWPYGWSRASIPFNLPLFPWTHGRRLGGHAPERGDVVPWSLLTAAKTRVENNRVLPALFGTPYGLLVLLKIALFLLAMAILALLRYRRTLD